MQGSEVLLTSVSFADVDIVDEGSGHEELRESIFEATFSLASTASVSAGSVFLDKTKLESLPGIFLATDIFVAGAKSEGFVADPQGSIAFGNGQSRLRLKGTLAELNNASKILSLRLAPNFTGNATLKIDINDLGCCSAQSTDLALSSSTTVSLGTRSDQRYFSSTPLSP